jgi:predicted TIM-barrel fold metal-dependent hydrolase
MSDIKQIYLSEFDPKSELVVKEHNVARPKFPVVDFHIHCGRKLMGDDSADQNDVAKAIEDLKQCGVKGVINLDGSWDEKLNRMLEKTEPFKDFIHTFCNVDASRLDDEDFEPYVKSFLKQAKDKGVKGIKFFKSLSLVLKDKQGKYIAADDSRLKVIWDTAAELNLPVLIHIADPIAFFKPIDRYNERYDELQEHPDWSYSKPEFYSFETLMKMQENLLAQNPKTTFIVAHVGSCAEDLGYVGNLLDRFPNMYIDIAARIAELGRQPYTSQEFFVKFQDRILFGTDAEQLSNELYPYYYRFLETKDEYFKYAASAGQGRWNIYGIGLEDSILEKIYYKNAEKILNLKLV